MYYYYFVLFPFTLFKHVSSQCQNCFASEILSEFSGSSEILRVVFYGTRQFRLMINTLHRIGGSGGLGLVELDGLPTEDNEVVCRVLSCRHLLIVYPVQS